MWPKQVIVDSSALFTLKEEEKEEKLFPCLFFVHTPKKLLEALFLRNKKSFLIFLSDWIGQEESEEKKSRQFIGRGKKTSNLWLGLQGEQWTHFLLEHYRFQHSFLTDGRDI